jgi:predicted cupin superfamily sugar epimerase
MRTASYWIRKLGLVPHPEGGYFRETYRSGETINLAVLPKRYTGKRSFSTAILFLLEGRQVSRLHRLTSDEVWHFHAGSGLTIHVITTKGRYHSIKLGPGSGRDEVFQAVVKSGDWFGATVNDAKSYSLAGCTVAPGFDFADFEIADASKLSRKYPRYRKMIERLTTQGKSGRLE